MHRWTALRVALAIVVATWSPMWCHCMVLGAPDSAPSPPEASCHQAAFAAGHPEHGSYEQCCAADKVTAQAGMDQCCSRSCHADPASEPNCGCCGQLIAASLIERTTAGAWHLALVAPNHSAPIVLECNRRSLLLRAHDDACCLARSSSLLARHCLLLI